MDLSQFEQKTARLLEAFTPLHAQHIPLSPDMVAAPDGVMPALLKRVNKLWKPLNIPPLAFTCDAKEASLLGFCVVALDLKRCSLLLPTLTFILLDRQGTDGIDLFPLLEDFFQEAQPPAATLGSPLDPLLLSGKGEGRC